MTDRAALVFLLDVDNTLFDNDRFATDLSAHLEQVFGATERERYWSLYAQRRARLGYADYLGSLEDFRAAQDSAPPLLQMSAFLLDYPFAERLYPRALETIAHLQRIGQPVILSDGDIVFQPRKVQRAGIWDAVSGRVLIYLHKEAALASMQRHGSSLYPNTSPNLVRAPSRSLASHRGRRRLSRGMALRNPIRGGSLGGARSRRRARWCRGRRRRSGRSRLRAGGARS